MAWSLPSTLEGGRNNNSAETRRRPRIFPKLRPLSLLSTTGKQSEMILRTIQGYTEERNLLNESHFGFRGHSMKLQCMRLTDYVTLNFSNNMSTAAVYLDYEKAFDTTWHFALLYTFLEL
jgi:hypothetical protein